MLVLGHDIALHVMDGNDNKRVNSDNGGLTVFPLWSLATRVAGQEVCHNVLLSRSVLHREVVGLQC